MRSVASLCLMALAACSSAPAETRSVTRGAEAGARWRQGQLEAAEAGYEQALAEDHSTVDLPAAIKHLNNLGVLALFDGRLEQARARFEHALDLCAAVDEPDLAQRLHLQLASCHLQANELDAAERELAELAGWIARAEPADRVQYHLLQAGLLLRGGQDDAARAETRIAAAAAETAEERAAASLLEAKASAALPGAARAAFERALEHARAAGQLPMTVESLLGIAGTYGHEDRAAAARYCGLALEAARARGFDSLVPRILREQERFGR